MTKVKEKQILEPLKQKAARQRRGLAVSDQKMKKGKEKQENEKGWEKFLKVMR